MLSLRISLIFGSMTLIPTLPACTDARGAAADDLKSHGATAAPSVSPLHVGNAAHSSARAELGKKLFFDPSLSASGQMACATCHDPAHAYGPANDRAVQLGGADRTSPGIRAVPSLMYKEYTPAYADLLDNPDGFSAPGPGGGFAWDGRANTLAEQAKGPLFSPFEMANRDAHALAERLRRGGYEALYQRAFPGVRLSEDEPAVNSALIALQAFQLEDASFHPYTSKFDLHAGNKLGGEFSAAEARGFRVFADPQTGNCTSCHFPGAGLGGSSGLFTDFSFEAIGVPHRAEISGAASAGQADLGICGPVRDDHHATPEQRKFCGMFKTPTLRNLRARQVFFHNGVIHSLEQALRFYNTRDTLPELWYPTLGGVPKAHPDRDFPSYGLITTQYSGGRVQKFDDLPQEYRANIDTQKPLDGRPRGARPPLSEQNLQDLLCFLDTLNDGYDPSKPQQRAACSQ